MRNILLIQEDLENTPLEDLLKARRLEVFKVQHSPQLVALVQETRPDAVIVNIASPDDKLMCGLQALNQHCAVPVLMFTEDASAETVNKSVQAEVSAYVVGGVTEPQVSAAIHLALARFKQHRALKEALDEARSQLEDRKLIDRAKAILIKTQNFTEDHAYHTLRKLAMDRNITLGEMARNVIAMAELLK